MPKLFAELGGANFKRIFRCSCELALLEIARGIFISRKRGIELYSYRTFFDLERCFDSATFDGVRRLQQRIADSCIAFGANGIFNAFLHLRERSGEEVDVGIYAAEKFA